MTSVKKEETAFAAGKIHILYKVAFALIAGLGAAMLPLPLHLVIMGRVMLGWDVFCIILIAFYLLSFFKTPQTRIQQQAAEDDPSRVVIFTLLLVCSFAGMAVVILLISSQNISSYSRMLHLSIALVGMVCTWVLVHTIFTARYAHMYYRELRHNKTTPPLSFPSDISPDFLDFAYFSFVLGMTFQVSDVSINSRNFRHWALLHGIISFAYNAVIIALTINMLAGLH